MRIATYIAAAALLFAAAPASADVRLPAVFSQHMVVQADTKIPVWGFAAPEEEVHVSLAGAEATTRADVNGRWRVELPKLKVGGPHELVVQGKNKLTVGDVLVGEVWLGSGQSNMAMTVNRCLNYEAEQKAADLPQLRMFTVRSNATDEPQADCVGEWVVCKPDTVGGFSATAYFFGREIHKALGQPVGLINSSVGGTPIESWIPAAAQRAEPKLAAFLAAHNQAYTTFDPVKAKASYEKQVEKWKADVAKAKAAKKPLPRKPNDPIENRKRKGNVGGLYNGKIAPLVGYAVRGMLWYQGEANSTPEKSAYYQVQLPLLVTEWRRAWNQGDFAFAWVQLPNFGGNRPGWLIVREAMAKSLAVPNTGMAVTTDIGESKDIHPRNKQDVGKRLALWALAKVYARDIAYSGPMFKSATASGDGLVVTFDHVDGLKAGGERLLGFEIAGNDKKWHPAEARIEGATVVASSTEVKEPTAVRYNWHEEPIGNLTNATGLPAGPFRSQEWD
ncbi:MAG: sialate O-acetylesterase [Pirellulales bacterium]